MKLHEILHYNRKKKKHTLISLSKEADIPYGILYRLETGKIKKPHPDLLKQIAKPLELNYIDLLTKSGYSIDDKSDVQAPSSKTVSVRSLSAYFSNSSDSEEESITIADFDHLQDCDCVRIEDYSLQPQLKKGDLVFLKKATTISEGQRILMLTNSGEYKLGVAKQRDKDCALYSFTGVLLEGSAKQTASITHILSA